jgi:hypothetical protein
MPLNQPQVVDETRFGFGTRSPSAEWDQSLVSSEEDRLDRWVTLLVLGAPVAGAGFLLWVGLGRVASPGLNGTSLVGLGILELLVGTLAVYAVHPQALRGIVVAGIVTVGAGIATAASAVPVGRTLGLALAACGLLAVLIGGWRAVALRRSLLEV